MTGLLCKGISDEPLEGLLRQASVEPSERLSTHSAPRAIRLGKLIPQALSRMVFRFIGSIRAYQLCQPSFPTRNDLLKLP
jgi:hypothetical protein